MQRGFGLGPKVVFVEKMNDLPLVFEGGCENF